MTYTKLLELETKFSKKIAQNNDNIRFQEQRDKLSKFFHKLTRELKSLISEMGGDYVALKEMNFDHKTLEVLKEFRGHIIELMKNIDPERPYDGTNQLIDWVSERNNKSTLDNLNFIIHEFIKKNKIEFISTSYLKPIRVDSLNKLKNLLKSAKDYIEDNSLLPDPREQSTVPPPMLRNVKEEEFVPVSKDDVTVPGVPASKKEAI